MSRSAFLRPLVAFLLCVVSACKSSHDESHDGPAPVDWKELAAERWRLVELDGQPIARESGIELQFEGIDRVSGHAGINQFMGSYQHLEPNVLHFASLASTRMAGPPASMKLESAFLEALHAVDAARLDEHGLALLHQGVVTMRFQGLD